MNTEREYPVIPSHHQANPHLKKSAYIWNSQAHELQDDSADSTRRRKAILPSIAQWLQSLIYHYQLPQILSLELHSVVGRIRLRWRRLPFRLAGFPAYRLAPNGHLEPCTDSLACMKDTGNFFSSRPWATLIDVQTYQEGWKAGAKWASSNPGSYKLGLPDGKA